jgi:hypothetical protein
MQCSDVRCIYEVVLADDTLCNYHRGVADGRITDAGVDEATGRMRPLHRALKPQATPKLRYCMEKGCLEQGYERKCRRHGGR